LFYKYRAKEFYP
jgi:nucleoside diphosphate kinase